MSQNAALFALVLDDSERHQIAEILDRRANEIAAFKTDLEHKIEQALDPFPGSVELALTREIERLRRLSSRIKPDETIRNRS